MTTEITTHSDNVPATVTPMDLIAKASESGQTIDQMKQLFELQIRWEENEAKKAYHRAVAAFKAESITILKTKRVGYENKDGSFTGYSHATLGNIVQTIVPILSAHGLSHSWDICQSDSISVTCNLTHEMGYSTKVSMSAGKDDSGKKNLIQQVASTVTYLQRYTLLSITGLAAQDQDDDGKSAGSGKADDVPRVSERQWMDFTALVSDIKGDKTEKYLKGFCSYHRINDIAELPASKYDAAVVTLEKERNKTA